MSDQIPSQRERQLGVEDSICRSCGTTGSRLKQDAHRQVCERADVVSMDEALKPKMSLDAERVIADLISKQGLSYNGAVQRAEEMADKTSAPYHEAANVLRGWIAAGGHNRV